MNPRAGLLWSMLFLATGAEAATRYVGVCGAPNTATLAAAVAAAGAGDTILVCSGTYNEAVTVNKASLTIRSSTGNRADVTVSNAGTPFTLAASSLTLKDMTVTSSGAGAIADAWPAAGLHTFDNLAVTASGMGIRLQQISSGAHTFKNLTVTSTGSTAIQLDWNADGAHVFDTVTATGNSGAIYAAQGAGSFKNVTATAVVGDAIYLYGKYPASFDTVTATSANGRGIYIGSGLSSAFAFTGVTVTAKNMGIRIDRSGKLTMNNVKATSSNDNAIFLAWDADGAHELTNLDLSAANGHGIYASQGLGLVSDFKIVARNYGIYSYSKYDTTIQRGTVTSSNDNAIHSSSGSSKTFSVEDVTINAMKTGINLSRSSSASIQRVCVRRAVDGIKTDWDAHSVSIRDSQFANYTGYGVNIQSNNSKKATVTNNGFLKLTTPRAYSNSSAHNFKGNYWQGVAAGTNYTEGNVKDTATLGSNPVSSCYGDLAPPATLVAEWRMDEASWNGTSGEVKDNVGAAHATSVSGATTTTGKLCQAGIFNGTSAYVNLPNTTSLNFPSGGGYTFSAWVKTTDAYGEIVSFRDQTNDVPVIDLAIGYNGVGGVAGQFVPLVRQDGGGIAYLNSGGQINDGQWHFVALVYDPAAAKLISYVDGAKIGEAAHSNPSTLTTAGLRNIGREGRWVQDNFTSQDREYLSGQIDEVKIWNSALDATQIAAGHANEAAGRNWDGSARICAIPPPANPSALNAVNVGANPVTGKITTKTAGAPFSVDIYALNAARTAQDSAFNGAILVDLLANTSIGVALDANNCPTTATSLAVGTVTLTAGKATASMGSVADAWRDARVRMRYPATGAATVTACSADNFAVKPAVLSAIASHADWGTAGTTATLANTGAGGGVIHKAGRPFTVRVTGYNAGNAITGNYSGSPTAASTCVLPASGCVPGSFSAGAFSAAAGTLTSNGASYSEVGAISATFTDTAWASADSGDTAASCAGFHVCTTTAVNIGRFVPDHFDIATNTPAFTPACGGFTYLGQPFGFGAGPGVSPLWSVTARNNGGATTRNYSGSLFKIAAATITGQTWGAASGTVAAVGTLPAVAVSDLGNGIGGVTYGVGDPAAGGGLAFSRAATAPFDASLTLAASVADGEGVAYAGNPFQHGGIGFDDGNAATTSDAQMRFGRLRLANAVGSELLPLPLPLTAQYWNGQGYVSNALDNCTTISTPTLTFFSQTADNQLGQGETTASFNATLVAGNGNLRFSAPGAGNYGFMDLSVTAPAWLKFNWDGVDQGGDGDQLDDNPRARATFGKRKGSDKVIIRREMY